MAKMRFRLHGKEEDITQLLDMLEGRGLEVTVNQEKGIPDLTEEGVVYRFGEIEWK